MRKLFVFIPLAIFLVLGVLFYAQLGKDVRYMPSALIGKALPDFKMVPLESNELVGHESLPEGPYLINFWATWCPSCSVEHDYLMALAGQGIPIVGIDYKDEADAAKKWLIEKGDPYSVVLQDEMGHFGVDMGVTGAPETFVVDSQGNVAYRHQGVVNDAVWETLKGYMK